jgi:hypothetical protein
LHGAVRAPLEPLRVLLHIRVIRGALEGEVESYLDAILLALASKFRKSSSAPSWGCTAI